jgi:hypothetical protein
MVIKIYLEKPNNKVCVGKHLSDMFHIYDSFK